MPELVLLAVNLLAFARTHFAFSFEDHRKQDNDRWMKVVISNPRSHRAASRLDLSVFPFQAVKGDSDDCTDTWLAAAASILSPAYALLFPDVHSFSPVNEVPTKCLDCLSHVPTLSLVSFVHFIFLWMVSICRGSINLL